MARRFSIVCMLAITAAAQAEEFKVGPHTIRIPDGFEIELAVGPDLVKRPIALSFDEEGAIYVTDSAGMSDRANKQLELKPHSIRKVVDTDGDGIFDTSTLFADRMMFPEGCLWHDGSLYVAAPPEIWKLTDTTGDGKCDKREVWHDGQTLTGCGNDIHGPYLGPDGWFYWTKGAFAEQKYECNGRNFVTRSSHIFRALPDHSRMEPVLTGGMDNPVNVAFLPNGERFLSCTFFQYPLDGNRDGLIHSIFGGVYGKKHDSIYEHPMTGEVMPVMTHMGAAAPCGLLGVGSDETFLGQQQDRLFGCYFNLHKVVEHTLQPIGSTYKTTERDLIACDHPDFHPTDVQRAPDGSLLIVDTGGWYKVCCPTSQLAKPDVLGGIYRLRPKNHPTIADPLGKKLSWKDQAADEFVNRLADNRHFVRERAKRELRKLGKSAVSSLRKAAQDTDAQIRSHAIWTLAGIDLPQARDTVFETSQSGHNNADVLYAMSLWRDDRGIEQAVDSLSKRKDTDQRTARLSAELIGRTRSRPLDELLNALPSSKVTDSSGSPSDPAQRVFEHSIINAIMEIDQSRLSASLKVVDKPQHIRAILVALDQKSKLENTPSAKQSQLSAKDVLPFLTHQNESVSRTAAWVVGHHSEWGEQLAKYYNDQLNSADRFNDPLVDQLARLASAPAIQNVLAKTLASEKKPHRQIALSAMTRAELSSFPTQWLDASAALLPRLDASQLAFAVGEMKQWPLPKKKHKAFNDALIKTATSSSTERAAKIDALLIASPLKNVSDDAFQSLVSAISSNADDGLQTTAAKVLGTARLDKQQLARLIPLLDDCGPFELAAIIPVFQTSDKDMGHRFLDSLESSPGFGGLRVDQLAAVLSKCPDSVQDQGKQLLKKLNASVEEQTAQLESLLKQIKTGDARRGHELFNSSKTKCITCHKRGYNGGMLGPDLTRIGQVRNTRDLLEAIVFPSASIVRGYEPVTVILSDGRTRSGIIRSENREEIVLAEDAEKTRRINREDIEEILPANISLMPKGMHKILTPKDLSDLITFLRQ